MSIVIDVSDNSIVIDTTTGANTTQLSDLPAAGTLDSDDKVPVEVDGVWSLASLSALTVTSGTGGFAVLSGGNAFTGTQTIDNGGGVFRFDADASSNNRFLLEDNSGNDLFAVAPFAGAGAVAFGNATSANVFLYYSADGVLSFLLGRLAPRVTAVTGNAPTWTATCECLVVTSITGTCNLSTNFTAGSPLSGERLYVALTGNGTHSITWPSAMEASAAVALPTALTGSGVRMDVMFIYNSATSKWRVINVA